MSVRGVISGLVAGAAICALAAPLQAAGANDAEVRQLITGILDGEYKKKDYEAALQNLEVAKVVCEGDACSKPVRAELQIAIGTVQAALGNKAEASKAFNAALKDDPKAKLFSKYKNATAEKLFNAAKKTRASEARDGCLGSYQAQKGRGWKSGEAFHCFNEARRHEREKDWSICAKDARASLEREDRIGTRALVGRCLELDNRWGAAIAEYEEIARTGPKQGQFRAARQANNRARQLRRRMPVLILLAPEGAKDLVVKLDGTTLPIEVLGSDMPIDPGEHLVVAQGASTDLPLTFEEKVTMEPGRTFTLPIRLAPGSPKWATQAELKCLLGAKSQEQFSKCLSERDSGAGDLNFRAASEVSGYHDDMDVDVITPSISLGVEHVTDGWGVGASFLVDVVSAASVDILATASPRWTEVRWSPAINAHKKFDDLDISLAGSVSHEPDYISTSVGANAALELVDKTVTPSLGYQFSYDINGKVDTPFAVSSTDIFRHAINAGVGLVLTKATFGSVSATVVAEDGDSSKPYRHIPMFTPEAAAAIEADPGLVVAGVNLFRLPERPLEQLPTDRQRYATAFSLAHRFSNSTLRVSERIYGDSWGVFASTTDARFMYDIVKEFRVWPHLRFHGQGGASFYEIAYIATATPDGTRLPAIRTGDRELGPLVAVTAGLGARYDFGARRSWGVMFNGDMIYTRFLNHLFVKERYGFFGALTVEAEFE